MYNKLRGLREMQGTLERIQYSVFGIRYTGRLNHGKHGKHGTRKGVFGIQNLEGERPHEPGCRAKRGLGVRWRDRAFTGRGAPTIHVSRSAENQIRDKVGTHSKEPAAQSGVPTWPEPHPLRGGNLCLTNPKGDAPLATLLDPIRGPPEPPGQGFRPMGLASNSLN